MKKAFLLAPAGAAAIGVAALYLFGKKKAGKSAPEKGAKTPVATAVKLNCAAYSFASGYKNAGTVEVSFDYDAEKFDYAVVSEDFITATSDSHAGILRGADFMMQMEYAAYYGGEDFAALSTHVAGRYKGYESIRCNGMDGIKYFDGKSLCLAFPAAEDYLLLTFIATGDDGEDGYATLWDNADVRRIAETLTIKQ